MAEDMNVFMDQKLLIDEQEKLNNSSEKPETNVEKPDNSTEQSDTISERPETNSEKIETNVDKSQNSSKQTDPVIIDVANEIMKSESDIEENNIIEESEAFVAEEMVEAALPNNSEDMEVNKKVLSAVENLSSKIDEMNKLFLQKIQHTTHEEKIVDQMHAELQKYKIDMYSQLVRPILLDIIDVRDSILRIAKNYSEKPEGERAIPYDTFTDYAFDIQDILDKNNIEIYTSVAGDDFVPIKHRVIKKIPTTMKELHGKIAETMSDGYNYNGRPISPEKVIVYYYEEQKKEEIKGEV